MMNFQVFNQTMQPKSPLVDYNQTHVCSISGCQCNSLLQYQPPTHQRFSKCKQLIVEWCLSRSLTSESMCLRKDSSLSNFKPKSSQDPYSSLPMTLPQIMHITTNQAKSLRNVGPHTYHFKYEAANQPNWYQSFNYHKNNSKRNTKTHRRHFFVFYNVNG